MTWQPSARTAAALAVYEAAEQDRATRPERYRLDPDAVLERMAARGQIREAHFAKGWRAGLGAFLHSGGRGRSTQRGGRTDGVAVRDRQVDSRSEDREMAGGQPSPAPIRRWRRRSSSWVDGAPAPRSCYRLLGGDPRLHAQLPAELAAPWLFAESAPNAGPGIDQRPEANCYTRSTPIWRSSIHPARRCPRNASSAMGTDMRNWGFTSLMRLPRLRHVAGRRRLRAIRTSRYREALQLLAVNDDRRFVLKAPAHTAELRHIAREFPGAIVVHIHRDIVATIASGASLFAVYQSTYSDDVDAVDVGRRQADQSELWFRRATEFRSITRTRRRHADRRRLPRADRRHPRRSRSDLRRRRHACTPRARRLHRQLPCGAPTQQPHGTHRYEPQDFGLHAGELRERFRVSRSLSGCASRPAAARHVHV